MFMPYYLQKYLKLYVSQTRRLSQYLFLTVNVSSQALVFILTSIAFLQDPLQCLRSLFRVYRGRFLYYFKKEKLATRCHLLSFVVTCCHRCHSLSLIVIHCHSLSLVVPLVVTRCITSLSFYKQSAFHYSLSFVVTHCTTCCHSLSVIVSLVCLFINDLLFIYCVFQSEQTKTHALELCGLFTLKQALGQLQQMKKKE